MNASRKTLVLGASDNPDRYSNLAIRFLLNKGHEVVAIGRKKAHAYGVEISNETFSIEGVDTVTLYLNPTHQKAYYDYILSLKPQRVIFNPGTENEELENKLKEAQIPYMEACTLVMLNSGQY